MKAIYIFLLLAGLLAAQNITSEQKAEVARLDDEVSRLYGQGHFTDALTVAQQLLPLREKLFGPEHPETANSCNDLALIYGELGRFEPAVTMGRRALAIREKALGAENTDTALSAAVLATLFDRLGNFAESEPLYRRALAIEEKALGPGNPEVAQTLSDLGASLMRRGQYEAAEPLQARALAIREKALGPEHPDTAASLNNLASLYSDEGRYAEAEPLYRRALGIQEKALGPEHPSAARTMNNLADLYRLEGQYSQSETLFTRVVAIYEKNPGPEHPDTAIALNNLAEAYSNDGDYAKAEPLYARALAVQEKVFGPECAAVATTLGNLAILHEKQRQFAAAEPLFRRALAIQEKALGPEHPQTALTIANLAATYNNQGRYADAEPLYRRALAIREKTHGEDHRATGESMTNLALLLWEEKKPAEALTLLTRVAKAEEHQIEVNLSAGTEAQRLSFARTFGGSTDTLLWFQAEFPGAEARRVAFETILRRKGRVLDSLADELQAIRKHLGPAERKNLDDLTAVRAREATLVLQGPGTLGAEAYRRSLDETRAREDELVRALSQSSALFRAQAEATTLARVQAAIPEGAELIEYVRYEPFDPAEPEGQRWGHPRYSAFRLSRTGDPDWADLGLAAPIDQLLQRWRVEVGRPGKENTGAPLARQLYAALLEKILPQGKTHSLLIAPDGALHLLPWAALSDAQGRFLLDRYRVSLLDTGRDLLRMGEHATPRSPALIVANPAYDDAVRQWPALPGTHDEALVVREQLGGNTAELLEGSRASKSAILAVHGPRILHVATHGFFLPDQPATSASAVEGSRGAIAKAPQPVSAASAGTGENPLLRSGIVLAGGSTLTALETAQLDLDGTALVTLSACETGVGEITGGEGVFGLRRALTIAGAEAQLISLWKVDDKATADLMRVFYQRLAAGSGRAEALRTAQRELAARYPSPYYWAAFTLSGNPDPIP